MFKDVFNGIIEQKNLSLYKVAKDTKIPKTIIYDWAAGAREPVSEYIVILADYLECSVDFLLEREPAEPVKAVSPIIKVASVNIKQPQFSKKSLIEDMIYQKPLDINSRVSVEDILADNEDFWITVRDNSMIDAHIFNGTEVLIRRDVMPENGDLAAVLVNNEILLRRFFKEQNSIVLECANASCMPSKYDEKEITVLGRAVEIKSII